jgi:hypothetical protein
MTGCMHRGALTIVVVITAGTTLLIYDVAQRTFMPVEEANQRAGTGIFFYPDGRYLRATTGATSRVRPGSRARP